MPNTYTPIASTRITNTSTASHTFSSIPNTYTDLFITVTGQFTNTSDDLTMQINGDTGTNYSIIYIGSWPNFNQTGTSANQTFMYLDYWGNGVNNSQTMSYRINIQNYTNTNMFKTVLLSAGTGFINSSSGGVSGIIAGTWRSTSAITSIKLNSTAGNFSKNTVLSLYGIKAA